MYTIIYMKLYMRYIQLYIYILYIYVYVQLYMNKYGGFQTWVPQNGWLIVENPNLKSMIWGYPKFWDTSVV